MATSSIVILMVGALAGGFINGLAGFGTALFALGIWLQILPAPQAVATVVIMSVACGLQGLWIVRDEIRRNYGRVLIFLVPATIGVPLGIAILSVISASVLKVTIAAFLVSYGGFFTLRRSLPKFARPTPVIDTLVGFLSGVLGGAASLSGILPTMWCAMRPWTKNETRAVLQPFNFSVLAMTALMLAWKGQYTDETLLIIALALPATLIGSQIGITLFHRLNDLQFRRLLIALMFISGLFLAIRELL